MLFVYLGNVLFPLDVCVSQMAMILLNVIV